LVVLIFDVGLAGFFRWAEKRLRAIGIRACLAPYTIDWQIVEWAEREFGPGNFLIVTTDASFPCKDKVVLPTYFKTQKGYGKPKYEKLYTLLMKKLAGFGGRAIWASRSMPVSQPGR